MDFLALSGLAGFGWKWSSLLSNELCEILEHSFELFRFILSILSILSTKQGSLSREMSLEKELGTGFSTFSSFSFLSLFVFVFIIGAFSFFTANFGGLGTAASPEIGLCVDSTFFWT